MRTDKDSLTVAGAGAWLVLTSMQRASMMSVPLEISGRDWHLELERQKAAAQSAGGFFHGPVRPLWAAGREAAQAAPALYRYANSRSVARPIGIRRAVQYRY